MTDLSLNSPAARELRAPLQQEGTKAVLRTWLKPAGSAVRQDEPLVELETDKVAVEVSAPCDGVLEQLLAEGEDAEPGALLGRIRLADGAAGCPPEPAPRLPSSTDEGERALLDPALRLSPAVRRLLAEHQLDPAGLRGSGRGGRLTREDVVQALAARQVPAAAVQAPPVRAEAPAATEAAQAPRVAAHVPHSSMRRRIAAHMQHSVSVAPHVTTVFEADFSAIVAHRKRHKAAFAEQGVNLTFTAYFVAAAVEAMRVAPEVNSRWHEDYLELYKDVNVGVGAALGDKGLIVPVIHQAQDLSLLGIATRLQACTEAARSGKLKPADVQGGTFTISNHGVSGSLFAAPIIINQPQTAILGIGALERRVVAREVDGVESLQVRPMAYVSLTIDHRALDGSQTNAWLSRFVEVIQNWA